MRFTDKGLLRWCQRISQAALRSCLFSPLREAEAGIVYPGVRRPTLKHPTVFPCQIYQLPAKPNMGEIWTCHTIGRPVYVCSRGILSDRIRGEREERQREQTKETQREINNINRFKGIAHTQYSVTAACATTICYVTFKSIIYCLYFMIKWTEIENRLCFLSGVIKHQALWYYWMGNAINNVWCGKKKQKKCRPGNPGLNYGWFIGSKRTKRYFLQSEHVFPPPFDWQDIIGSDHRLFLNNRPMADRDNNS